jgi:hypothetical protein
MTIIKELFERNKMRGRRGEGKRMMGRGTLPKYIVSIYENGMRQPTESC